MHIGILQTGHVADALIPDHGDYNEIFPRFLDGYGFRFTNYAVVDNEFPASPDVADGWLITGSKHGAYEDHDWIPPLENLIRHIYARHIPLVGICFGHQIIAQALGGKVQKFDKGWAVGATDYDFNGETRTLNAWHQDQIITPPADARVIARNPFCEYAALAYDDRALTIQPHPEINNDYLSGLLTERAPGVVPDPTISQARARIGTKLHAGTTADQIAEFFKKPRTPHV